MENKKTNAMAFKILEMIAQENLSNSECMDVIKTAWHYAKQCQMKSRLCLSTLSVIEKESDQL